MIKLPYAISDFHRIRSEGYTYIDRTHYIPLLEEAGRQLVFLRPRRFGKSLLLSMLANYYDIARTDEADTLFGDLRIGQNPTPEQNRYLILELDFSAVSAQGDSERIRRNLFDHVNNCINAFAQKYQSWLDVDFSLNPDNAIASLEALAYAVRNSGHELYLLIDEYDNFANDVLMQHTTDKQRYRDLLEGEGILKTLFKVIKTGAAKGGISRVFITGVSPVVLSDMTSGYNIATTIYLLPRFNALCGLEQQELAALTEQVLTACGHDGTQQQAALRTMKQFYNGYRFCDSADKPLVYNPTLCFYFLNHYRHECEPPKQILDGNLAMDAGRVRYIASLPGGMPVIGKLADEASPATVPGLEERFGVEMLQIIQQDERYMLSLLYFFGVLTITGQTALGEVVLDAPNLVVRGMYFQQLRQYALPNPRDDVTAAQLATQFYQSGDLQALADFMENQYFAAFNNRDYRWSNELTVKTAFLTLLFNDRYYIMDSEAALQRRYSDLVMVIRPGMRKYPALKEFVFEFKYLKLAELGMSGEQVRSETREALQQLPAVQAALQDAREQLVKYQAVLAEKYREPERLCCLAVVALGFERLVWQNVGGQG